MYSLISVDLGVANLESSSVNVEEDGGEFGRRRRLQRKFISKFNIIITDRNSSNNFFSKQRPTVTNNDQGQKNMKAEHY